MKNRYYLFIVLAISFPPLSLTSEKTTHPTSQQYVIDACSLLQQFQSVPKIQRKTLLNNFTPSETESFIACASVVNASLSTISGMPKIMKKLGICKPSEGFSNPKIVTYLLEHIGDKKIEESLEPNKIIQDFVMFDSLPVLYPC